MIGSSLDSTLRSAGAPGPASAMVDVLHVIQPGEVGGAETVVHALATAQRARGARVAVAAVVHTERSAQDLTEALRRDSVEVHRVQIAGRAYTRERAAIAEICRTISPDVVHTHGYRADIVDGLAVRDCAAVVTTVHGYTGGGLKNRVYEALQRHAFRRFDAVVAVSSQLGCDLGCYIARERLHVVPNAISPRVDGLDRSAAREALGIPPEGFTLGFVGRMSPEKGADVLLDALAQPEAPAGARAVLLGDGPEMELLQRQAQRLGISSRVSWPGRIADAARFFSAFDVLVLSSRTEGTPMVLLEAMAAGTPIIATRVGGVPDVLPAGTALVVEPESPSQLAKAIDNVFKSSETARIMACAARRRLESNYSADNWVSRYEGVYRCALVEAGRRFR